VIHPSQGLAQLSFSSHPRDGAELPVSPKKKADALRIAVNAVDPRNLSVGTFIHFLHSKKIEVFNLRPTN